MSYIRCEKCNWSQDDFWNWEWKGLKKFWQWRNRPFGYNPFSLILEDIAENFKPRIIVFDSFQAKEWGWMSNKRHSWRVMIWEIKRDITSFFKQKWWTYESWKKNRKNLNAWCPTCKSNLWNID